MVAQGQSNKSALPPHGLGSSYQNPDTEEGRDLCREGSLQALGSAPSLESGKRGLTLTPGSSKSFVVVH